MPKIVNKKYSKFETQINKAFVALAKSLGLTPAAGMVTAALYFAEKPLSSGDLEKQLRMAHGTVYTVLKILNSFGVLRSMRHGRVAEMFELNPAIRPLAVGAIKNNFLPAIATAISGLTAAREIKTKDVPECASERIDSLLKALAVADEQLKQITADVDGNDGNKE